MGLAEEYPNYGLRWSALKNSHVLKELSVEKNNMREEGKERREGKG